MTIQPIEVNGWTIKPCDTCTQGYEVSHTVSYPEPTLEAAVRAAQRFPSKTLLIGDPEYIDAQLRELMPDHVRLAFYQWIGRFAVGEAVAVATRNVGEDPVPPQHRSYSQDTVYEFFELINPANKDYQPFPSELPDKCKKEEQN